MVLHSYFIFAYQIFSLLQGPKEENENRPIKKPISLDRPEAEPLRRSWSPPVALHLAGATMADMGGQIDKMVSFIHFEAKNKKEEILAKAKQDKEAKKLELVHREKLKIDADFNKRIKNVDTQNKMCAPRPLAPRLSRRASPPVGLLGGSYALCGSDARTEPEQPRR